MRLLEEDGNRVRAAESGEEAVAACAAERPDLVVLDYRLPDMTGLEALERIVDASGRNGPAVLVSGHALGVEARRAAAELGVRVFRKTVRPEPFLAYLRDAGGGRAAGPGGASGERDAGCASAGLA